LSLEVFVGTGGKEPFIKSLGLSLSSEVNVNSAKYGRILRGSQHLGEGGIHPEGYNQELKRVLTRFRETNPDIKILTERHMDEILEQLPERFKKFNRLGKKPWIDYSTWKNALGKLKLNSLVRARILVNQTVGRALKGAGRSRVSSAKGGLGAMKGLSRTLRSASGPVLKVLSAASLVQDQLNAQEYAEALKLQYMVRGYSEQQVEELMILRRWIDYRASKSVDLLGLPNLDYDPYWEEYLDRIPDDEIIPEGEDEGLLRLSLGLPLLS